LSPHLQTFHGILRGFRNNEVRPSIALILAWIVVCDDSPGEEKVKAFSGLVGQWGLGQVTSTLFNIAKGDCLRSIQLASEVIQLAINPEGAAATLNLCIALAAADNYLSISENLILRYVARLLNHTSPLGTRYRAVTGSELPAVGDPSSPAWWREREGQKENARTQSGESRTQAISEERLRALFVLGLDEKATEADIHAAYRRLSQVHHPDKFHSLGADAVKSATETFKRIQAAYEFLTRR
jgi:hypothetical protein